MAELLDYRRPGYKGMKTEAVHTGRHAQVFHGAAIHQRAVFLKHADQLCLHAGKHFFPIAGRIRSDAIALDAHVGHRAAIFQKHFFRRRFFPQTPDSGPRPCACSTPSLRRRRPALCRWLWAIRVWQCPRCVNHPADSSSQRKPSISIRVCRTNCPSATGDIAGRSFAPSAQRSSSP